MPRHPGEKPDLVLVLAEQNRGWILDRICQEIQAAAGDGAEIHESPGDLPAAPAYFFSHYSLLRTHLDDPVVRTARRSVWFTHPPEGLAQRLLMIKALRHADVVISGSSHLARWLGRRGVRSSKIVVIVPGTEPHRFTGHDRGDGIIGFCSAFYPRKAPERIVEIARAMPSEQFLLIGRGWQEWEAFDDLAALPNLEYLEIEHEEYPAAFARMDIFISPSRLEGGPIPVLEAMASNAVPIATDTGFARDLIQDGHNGLIVPTSASAADYASAINAARRITTDVRATVEHLTWARFASAVAAQAMPLRP